jgi:hypothetical protein
MAKIDPTPEHGQPRERGATPDVEKEKQRIPAEPIPQRPGEPPIGNGGTDEPAAFPPHN